MLTSFVPLALHGEVVGSWLVYVCGPGGRGTYFYPWSLMMRWWDHGWYVCGYGERGGCTYFYPWSFIVRWWDHGWNMCADPRGSLLLPLALHSEVVGAWLVYVCGQGGYLLLPLILHGEVVGGSMLIYVCRGYLLLTLAPHGEVVGAWSVCVWGRVLTFTLGPSW